MCVKVITKHLINILYLNGMLYIKKGSFRYNHRTRTIEEYYVAIEICQDTLSLWNFRMPNHNVSQYFPMYRKLLGKYFCEQTEGHYLHSYPIQRHKLPPSGSG